MEVIQREELISTGTDENLREQIAEKLWGHTEVNVTNVKVFAKNGFVSLTGNVDGPDAKAFVEGLIRSIEGVLDVVSFLKIIEPTDFNQLNQY